MRTPKAMAPAARDLDPFFEISGRSLVLDTASLAPAPLSMPKPGMPLERQLRDPVAGALDTLFGSH
ncbi:MAG: hypothetical protein JNL85_00260 [Rubrivivax sp.]|nr:hypothetical protein [Rubrivivax sp.]